LDPLISELEKPRLVVLLPQALADNLDLGRKIHGLAHAGGSDVVYLALLENPEDLWTLTRSLVTLKAITSADILAAGYKIIPSAAWMEALADTFRPGDSLVYTAEQRVSAGFLQTQPLGRFLEINYAAPLVELKGYYNPRALNIKRAVLVLITWLGFLAIIAGFSFLEIQVDQGIRGAARTLFLLITAGVEIWAVYAWNKLFQG